MLFPVIWLPLSLLAFDVYSKGTLTRKNIVDKWLLFALSLVVGVDRAELF